MSSTDTMPPARLPATKDRGQPEAQPTTEPKVNPPRDPTKLGLKFGGGPSEGHTVTMSEGTLEAIFRTDEPFQANALLGQCLKVLSTVELGGGESGAGDERHFVLSIIKDLAPRDAVERMLAVQMVATHVATVRAASSLARSNQIPQLEANSTNYNKLARTFTAQVEALKRHRSKGRQIVRVERVNVEPGGQAIVGDVHHGGRGAEDER